MRWHMPLIKVLSRLKIWQAPLYWSLFPTIVIFSHNVNELSIERLGKPLTISLLFVIMSALVAKWIFHQHHKAAIFTTAWTIIFFSFGYIYLKLGSFSLVDYLPFSLAATLSAVCTLSLIILSIWLLKTEKSLHLLLSTLSLIGGFLLTYNLLNSLPTLVSRSINTYKLKTFIHSQSIKTNHPVQNKSNPDIYYIIFDRYARSDILKQYLDYSNHELIQNLQSNGFFIPEESYANYPSTFLSLASSLNFIYLDQLGEILGANSSDHMPVYQQLIQSNQVATFLKAQGYQYVVAGDFWDPTKTSPLADFSYNVFTDFDEFHLYIYERTWLNTLLGIFGSRQIYTGAERLYRMQQNVSIRLNGIKQHVGSPTPTFMLAHFLLPHDPNVFSSTCKPLSFEAMRHYTEKESYLAELQCANLIMEDLADFIKNHSNRPYVLIFQADEGPFLPREYFPVENPMALSTPDAVSIHSAILNAIYISPDSNQNTSADYETLGFYPQISPVNTFRLVFNHYFNTSLPILEDKTFIFSDAKYPYQLNDITVKRVTN